MCWMCGIDVLTRCGFCIMQATVRQCLNTEITQQQPQTAMPPPPPTNCYWDPNSTRKTTPLQFVNNSADIPLVPGPELYSTIVQKNRENVTKQTEKTIIISTSITKGIDSDEFGRLYNGQECHFRRFPGGKMNFIKEYAKSHFEKEMPDTVVIVCGGNDLSSKKTVPQIANRIIDVGIMAKMHGVSKVVISSVFHYQLNRHWLNKLLRDLCVANNFCFLNNNNIFLPFGI